MGNTTYQVDTGMPLMGAHNLESVTASRGTTDRDVLRDDSMLARKISQDHVRIVTEKNSV